MTPEHLGNLDHWTKAATHAPCRCLRGGGTRSAKRSRNSNGENSTTPFAPGRVDLRPRPGAVSQQVLERPTRDTQMGT